MFNNVVVLDNVIENQKVQTTHVPSDHSIVPIPVPPPPRSIYARKPVGKYDTVVVEPIPPPPVTHLVDASSPIPKPLKFEKSFHGVLAHPDVLDERVYPNPKEFAVYETLGKTREHMKGRTLKNEDGTLNKANLAKFSAKKKSPRGMTMTNSTFSKTSSSILSNSTTKNSPYLNATVRTQKSTQMSKTASTMSSMNSTLSGGVMKANSTMATTIAGLPSSGEKEKKSAWPKDRYRYEPGAARPPKLRQIPPHSGFLYDMTINRIRGIEDNEESKSPKMAPTLTKRFSTKSSNSPFVNSAGRIFSTTYMSMIFMLV